MSLRTALCIQVWPTSDIFAGCITSISDMKQKYIIYIVVIYPMMYIEYASHVFADCVEEQRKENKQPADETQELKEEVWAPNKQPAVEAQELTEGAQEPEKPPAVESPELSGENFHLIVIFLTSALWASPSRGGSFRKSQE